jgi:hypothetical protein
MAQQPTKESLFRLDNLNTSNANTSTHSTAVVFHPIIVEL